MFGAVDNLIKDNLVKDNDKNGIIITKSKNNLFISNNIEGNFGFSPSTLSLRYWSAKILSVEIVLSCPIILYRLISISNMLVLEWIIFFLLSIFNFFGQKKDISIFP